MSIRTVLVLAAALGCAASVDAAQAHVRSHRHRHGHADRALLAPPHYPVTIGYGDTIVSGRTGLHRSDFGVMVPDGGTPNFVLTGRKAGTGLGANGLPGSNLDD